MALNLKEFRFLVVDDLREMRMTLRSMLESMRVGQVLEAKNADEALEALRLNPVDIVLCDYNLGEARDGQQLFEEARGRNLLVPHAAWLMITAEQSMAMVMGVVENHPDGYLVKPINKASLQVRIERAMARKMIVKDVEVAMRNTDYARAIASAEDLTKRFPNAAGELTRLKTEALLRMGDFEAAAETCTRVLEEREHAPGDHGPSWALLALGRARYALGDVSQARQAFQKVIEQQPSIVEAYDHLARIEREQDNARTAQRILTNALGISSRSIRRQQTLGDLATENKDFPTAERVYDKVLQMTEDSVFARPDDQVGLVSAVRATKGTEAGLKLVGDLAKRAARKKNNRGPHWRLSTVEASMLNEAGRTTEAAAAASRALDGFVSDLGATPAGPTVDLARVCFAAGLDGDARGIIDKLVRENHDRTDVVESVQAMFKDLGMADEGAALIESAQQALIKINNEGVMLAKAGRYKEAIAALAQVAQDLPNNLTVTLNVVQALLLQIRVEGPTNPTSYQVREHLARAEKIAPKSEKVMQLRNKLQSLLTPAPHKAAV